MPFSEFHIPTPKKLCQTHSLQITAIISKRGQQECWWRAKRKTDDFKRTYFCPHSSWHVSHLSQTWCRPKTLHSQTQTWMMYTKQTLLKLQIDFVSSWRFFFVPTTSLSKICWYSNFHSTQIRTHCTLHTFIKTHHRYATHSPMFHLSLCRTLDLCDIDASLCGALRQSFWRKLNNGTSCTLCPCLGVVDGFVGLGAFCEYVWVCLCLHKVFRVDGGWWFAVCCRCWCCYWLCSWCWASTSNMHSNGQHALELYEHGTHTHSTLHPHGFHAATSQHIIHTVHTSHTSLSMCDSWTTHIHLARRHTSYMLCAQFGVCLCMCTHANYVAIEFLE